MTDATRQRLQEATDRARARIAARAALNAWKPDPLENTFRDAVAEAVARYVDRQLTPPAAAAAAAAKH